MTATVFAYNVADVLIEKVPVEGETSRDLYDVVHETVLKRISPSARRIILMKDGVPECRWRPKDEPLTIR